MGNPNTCQNFFKHFCEGLLAPPLLVIPAYDNYSYAHEIPLHRGFKIQPEVITAGALAEIIKNCEANELRIQIGNNSQMGGIVGAEYDTMIEEQFSLLDTQCPLIQVRCPTIISQLDLAIEALRTILLHLTMPWLQMLRFKTILFRSCSPNGNFTQESENTKCDHYQRKHERNSDYERIYAMRGSCFLLPCKGDLHSLFEPSSRCCIEH